MDINTNETENLKENKEMEKKSRREELIKKHTPMMIREGLMKEGDPWPEDVDPELWEIIVPDAPDERISSTNLSEFCSTLLFDCCKKYNSTSCKEEKKSIKSIMAIIIRKNDDLKRPFKSRKAQDMFKDIDLSNFGWHDQNKFDPKRKSLIFEHKDTVKETIKKILKANSIEEILEIISITKTVWITREENDLLTRKGFASNRPDSDLAYKECGIEIL